MPRTRNCSKYASRWLVVLGVILAAPCAFAETMEKNVLLVKFNPDVTAVAAREVISRTGALSVEPLSRLVPPDSPSSRWWRVGYPTPESLSQAIRHLASEPAVDRTERPEPVTIY